MTAATEPPVKDPWKIAQIVGRLGGGGAQRLAYNLAAALDKLETSDHLISDAIGLRSAGGFVQADRPRTFVLHVRKSVRSLFGGLLRLRRLIRREQYDLLHIHGSDCLLFVHVATLAMRSRPRIAFTWHDSGNVLNARGIKGWAMRWAARRCDLLFGSSRSVTERLGKAIDDPKRVQVFRNGVPIEPEQMPERASHDALPRILWAGRLDPPKDPQILLRAVAALRERGKPCRLTMIGSALPHLQWFFEQTQQLAAQLDIRAFVEFPGWVDDLPRWLAQADIAVQSSHTEGLSMAVLEQMMAGLAIVATDVGDTDQAIEHEKTGLLIPPKDDAALIEALEQLIDDPQKRESLGRAARDKAVQAFSTQAMAANAWASYRGVLV